MSSDEHFPQSTADPEPTLFTVLLGSSEDVFRGFLSDFTYSKIDGWQLLLEAAATIVRYVLLDWNSRLRLCFIG